MLAECKLALRITAKVYDAELCSLMEAAAGDLEAAGVELPGTVSFSTGSGGVITDTSTLTDALTVRAILTYVRCHFGSPDDFDRLKAAYDEQKVQLMHATGHTDWGDEE